MITVLDEPTRTMITDVDEPSETVNTVIGESAETMITAPDPTNATVQLLQNYSFKKEVDHLRKINDNMNQKYEDLKSELARHQIIMSKFFSEQIKVLKSGVSLSVA